MLKKISAALIAVSMLAAPAMAAGTKAQTAPITKPVAPDAQTRIKAKPGVLNAHAKMGGHHHHRHQHRSHKKMGANKAHSFSTSAVAKPAVAHSKRG